tara:strand:- start:255 stop:386 length:132 start_codon:yes stop_codon:yes gene_type:complete
MVGHNNIWPFGKFMPENTFNVIKTKYAHQPAPNHKKLKAVFLP